MFKPKRFSAVLLILWMLFAPARAEAATAAAAVGQSVTISIQAAGTSPFSFQWYKDGAPVNNATSSAYTLAAVTLADSGSYTVEVSNASGVTMSDVAVLSVTGSGLAAPVITTQPANATVTAGQSASFTVVAGGTAPLTYQWYKAGVAISGATAATYTISSTTTASAGSYSVNVSNSAGAVSSSTAALTVASAVVAPVITTQPAGSSVNAGASVSFSVAASGTAPLTYQWYKGGVAISGANSAAYTLSAATLLDAGSYSVSVGNTAGTVTSANATLAVNPLLLAPTLTTLPSSASVNAGQTAAFSVVASGTAPLSYQWQKNGVAISGATGSSFSIMSAGTFDAGNYTVTVTNSAGAVTSAAATLTVTSPAVAPAITSQPQGITAKAGRDVSFSVVASGTGPLSYQWRLDGVLIAGANQSTYVIPLVGSTHAGTYTVTVSNTAGAVTSAGALLKVNVPPSIRRQPASAVALTGTAVPFSVVAEGTQVLSYQWQKNGASIAGATAETLTIASASVSDAGGYSVIVSNSEGTVTSDVATLTVSPSEIAPTITAQPASRAANSGQAVALTVVASGTGPLSYQWKKDGLVIPGATLATYTIPVVKMTDAGGYTVTVVNNVGAVSSSPAVLTVNWGQQVLPGLTQPYADWRQFKPQQLTVAPYSDTPLQFTAVSTVDDAGRTVLVGTNSIQGAFFVSVATATEWHGVLSIPGASSFEIHISGELVTVTEKTEALSCGASATLDGGVTPLATTSSDDSTMHTVDVLFFHDAASLAAAGGTAEAMESVIAARVTAANQVLANSGVNLRWRYLGAYQVPAFPATGSLVDDLNRVSSTGNTVGQFVQEKSVAHAADQSVFYVTGTRDYAGVARTVAADGGVAHFAALLWNQDFRGLTHELAHNFGCRHDRQSETTARDSDGKYAYGHRFTYNGEAAGTVMSLAADRWAYFSNPAVSYGSTPLGVSENLPNAANNARMLREKAASMAAYRGVNTSSSSSSSSSSGGSAGEPNAPQSPSPSSGSSGAAAGGGGGALGGWSLLGLAVSAVLRGLVAVRRRHEERGRFEEPASSY